MRKRVKPPPSCNVYTPTVLARAMVRALRDAPGARWLEPCVGKGAFLKALTEQRVEAERIVGLDLCHAAEPTDVHAVVRRGIEFLQWSALTSERFDRVIANPPYIALSKLPSEIRSAALGICDPDGTPIAGSGNCWYAFLCASLGLLTEGGSLAFVLPAAFDYADYARSLRESLPTLFGRVEVHRSRTPVFEGVEEGSIVLLAHGFRKPNQAVSRQEYDTLDELVRGLGRPMPSGGRAHETSDVTTNGKGIRLGDVMTIGLGAVTGDAGYFLMTEEERGCRQLPKSAVLPVVSKSKHIRMASICPERWKQLLHTGERIWLFRPSPSIVSHAAVQRYLDCPLGDGGCRRDAYKIRHRTPWYVTPLPRRPAGFISGMSHFGPWICLNRMDRLSATNTLYTVRFRKPCSDTEENAWALMLLTSAVREQLPAAIREYALGLAKLEPGDLSQLRLPTPRIVDAIPHVYQAAVESLLSGDADRACSIADKYASDG